MSVTIHPTPVRLDRAFCSVDWDDIFRMLCFKALHLEFQITAPWALLLGLKVCSQGKRRFHFESFWPKMAGFLDAVKQNWEAPVTATCPVESLFMKLQRLSRGLQKQSQRKVGNVKLQLAMAKEILHRLEIARDS